MNKKNNTKRQLLAAVLALVMCVSMFVGSTFAWFTDSVVTGNNKIIAGNLDVELEYANEPNGTYTSVEGIGDIFVAPTGETKGLWEPGHTEVAYLKVRNAGTLALKYNLSVSPFAETVGYNAENKEIKLSEILKFAATEPTENAPAAYTRESAQAAASASAQKLYEYTASNLTLLPGEEKYVTLVVYMPEEVGNEANYRGEDIPTIEFAVTLLATQETYENDSFDNQYDDIQFVSDAQELVAALASEKDIMLASDIDLTDEKLSIAENKVINLNGKTLSGKSTSAASSALVEVKNGATLTLKNGKVSFYATTPDTNWGGVGQPAFPGYANNAIVCKGNLVIDGAVVENLTAAGGASYAIDCYPGANLVVNSGVINGNGKNAIRMFANSATEETNVTINGGTVTGTRAVWVQLPSSNAEVAPKVNLTVNGGTLISTDTEYNLIIYSYSYGNSFKNTNIALNGGTYYGNVGLGGGAKIDYENVTVNEANTVRYGEVSSYNDAANFTTIPANAKGGIVSDPVDLVEKLKEGGNVIMTDDVTAPLSQPTIYGTPAAAVQKGGVLDGNGNKLIIENPKYNGYAIETYGGTIKNLIIDSTVGRGIVISSPKENVYIDNVVVDGPGYAINTTEYGYKDLFVTNSTVKGWTSLAGLNKVVFTDCIFGENTSKYWQNTGYGQDYDRLIKLYSPATFNSAEFEKGYYIDLSSLSADYTVVLNDCVCEGVVITEANYADYITIELPAGRTLADCVAFN